MSVTQKDKNNGICEKGYSENILSYYSSHSQLIPQPRCRSVRFHSVLFPLIYPIEQHPYPVR